jgi:hypothetical protein
MLRRIPPKNMEVPRALPMGLHFERRHDMEKIPQSCSVSIPACRQAAIADEIFIFLLYTFHSIFA